MEDELNQLLGQLHGGQGQVVSSGRFTLDLRKARDKLRQYQLAEPCFYLMKVLQAAVAGGAQRVDVSLGRRTVHFHASLSPGSPLRQSQALIDGLQEPQGMAPGALRHLAVGINSAWAVQPARVSFTWWSAERETGWCLQIGSEEMQLEPVKKRPGTPAIPLTLAGLEFFLERDKSLGSYVRSVSSEHLGILHRCAFCPVPLYLDSRRVIGQWSRPEAVADESWMGGPYFMAERILTDPDGGFQLCAPPWKQLQAVESSFVNPTEVVMGEKTRCPTFSYQGHFEGHGDTVRARLALALPVTLMGASRVVLVKDGVTLEPLAPAKHSLRHVGLQALLSAPGVSTDLSEFNPIQDEALADCLNGLTGEVAELIEEALPLVESLPLHRIVQDADQANQGCAMLLGCMFAYTIIGPLLALFITYQHNKEVKRQHGLERDRLRRSTLERLTDLKRSLAPSPG